MTIHDDCAAEGVDHLQTAALELIAAARVFLDAAEELVHDRERVHDVVATVTSLAGAADPLDLFGRRRRGGRPRTARASGPIDLDDGDDVVVAPADGPADEADPGRPGVQHIDIS